ncbi:MAG: EVE domain-containing protein [Chloroflexota bacterium]
MGQQYPASGAFNAYIVVGGPEIFARTRALGFTLHGFKSTRRKLAAGIKPGDRLIFYLTGLKRFAGIARVTSEMFEDHTPVWSSPKKPAEDYPYRVRIEPEVVLDEADAVAAEPLAQRMTYTKKWPPEHWTLAFQGNLHKIPAEDYELIRQALQEAGAAQV